MQLLMKGDCTGLTKSNCWFSLLLLFTFSFSLVGYSQEATKVQAQKADSISQNIELEPTEIIAWFNPQPVVGLTASAQTISSRKLEVQSTTTLLPALNTVAGIRMEERSPGSYRIAMRGSLIRSPFGIRNTKVYVDEFPLTDAGGNTYLNLLDPASIHAIHVIKGPDGSLYGANSGGVIRIQPGGFNVSGNRVSLLLSGGSYRMFQEQFSLQRKVSDKYSFAFDQSFTRSEGYRENTALNKRTFQTGHEWSYSKNNQLRLLVFYTNIEYRTPGGLTVEQMHENPQMARPATVTLPSAAEQKAGVHDRTFFGGIAHEAALSHKFSHTVSLFGSHTDFENPFITNYEFRKEKNAGIRTWFQYKDTIIGNLSLQMQLGFEGQTGSYRIDNYDNEQGRATQIQAMDDLTNSTGSFFYRATTALLQRWSIEASVGLNNARIKNHQRYPVVTEVFQTITFGSILMPRFATSYLLREGLAVRGSISKGYSLPAIAEVRSSDNTFNTDLEAETGINYEAGIRWETTDRRIITDISLYHYIMENGIVRQLRENGTEYYINAGRIKQNGAEVFISAYLLPLQNDRYVRTLNLQTALTYNHYRFGRYQVSNEDYSNNKVTAVPDLVWTNTLLITLPWQAGLNLSHNYTSDMPLNDANTVFSGAFHLVQLKATVNIKISRLRQMQLFAGIDNLLNEKYSLGNDINAFGSRYFNPAPPRNYYFGIKIT